jgi:ABC-type uncharacterized transport system permease subunit
MLPTTGQIALLIVAIALFALGGAISIIRLQRDKPRLRIAAKACMWSGVTVALAVLVWHSIVRQSWLPLEDNFDSLTWLAVVLAVFVMYVQRRKPLGGLDWFVMPIVILLLVGAVVTGLAKPQIYDVHNLWSWVHLAGVYGGAAAFAVAGAAGAMYLITNYRLRHKVALAGPSLGSLERLEHLTLTSVTLGFALLTIGAVIGFMKMTYENRPAPVTKLVLSGAVWIVFALVMHSPFFPSFRGRRAAVLSIVGFVLMVVAVVVVLVMPDGG